MNCVDALHHKEFRWLVFYLRDTESTTKSLEGVPRDVITDSDLLQGYVEILNREDYLKAHYRNYRGKREIDAVHVNKTIHVLAREATDYEALAESKPIPET
jgi:hypothetical protein